MAHPYFDVSRPTVIGHRGCAGEAPENTLPSFERGLAAGAAILETDAHLTRDGVPVLLHDDRVDRVSEGTGAVRDLALEELRRLDFGHRFSPDGGRTHPFRGAGVRVATLEEALSAFPEARFNIELKEQVPGLVAQTLDVLSAAGREAACLLTAAEDPLMTELRSEVARRSSPVALGASAGEILAFVRAALDGTPPDPGPMALQVPADFRGKALVTERFIRHAHAHDLAVHVWTINEEAEMKRLLDLGADGLVTDFPGRLAALLEGRRAPTR